MIVLPVDVGRENVTGYVVDVGFDGEIVFSKHLPRVSPWFSCALTAWLGRYSVILSLWQTLVFSVDGKDTVWKSLEFRVG